MKIKWIIFLITVFFYGNISAAQDLQDRNEFTCVPENITYNDFFEGYLLGCSLEKPVDEEELRRDAEKAYKQINGDQYHDLYIFWILVKNDNGEITIIDIGGTYLKNGELISLIVPQSRAE